MRLPGSEDFFVFVTSGGKGAMLVGESHVVTSSSEEKCQNLMIHLLNCLIPASNTDWLVGNWLFSFRMTACSYDLTRLSLPDSEINLTHVLNVSRVDHQPFSWSQAESILGWLLAFLSFANCSRISGPVVFGKEAGNIKYFRFATPPRSLPTNRRSWATNVDPAALCEAFMLFLRATGSSFWASILDRAIEWQILTDIAVHDSVEQALFTIQTLLEMLSYVVLVEDSKILGEDGYTKLPASDRITLLCGQSSQSIALGSPYSKTINSFCDANGIRNAGELITVLRNKLIHPTRKNRDYLDQVPPGVRAAAVTMGLQIASLMMLKVIGYKGEYFDLAHHEKRGVPWQ